MKKTDRLQSKLRLVVQRETVLHLDREQLARVGGASARTMCESCVLPVVTDPPPPPP